MSEEKVTKIFLSHNMSNLTEEEVNKIRYSALNTINKDGKLGFIQVIDNYHHYDAPENAGRLWHLGRSIQQMSEADCVYFCDPNATSSGCIIERLICQLYDINVLK